MRRMVLGCFVFLFVGLLTPLRSWGDCLELKNDSFDPKTATAATAVRHFCISEYFGATFTASEDITLQTIRLLVSGDGKTIMGSTILKLEIYEEGTDEKPGQKLLPETPYQAPPLNGVGPHWFEISKLGLAIKKGTRFRVTFGHDEIDCSLRTGGAKPSCPLYCNWWSATVDKGPLKPKTHTILGRMFGCDNVNDGQRKWRYWDDLPTGCQPTGNLILRLFASTATGPSCTDTCTQGAPCVCAGGKTGTSVCDGNVLKECKCETTGDCSGQTRACKCNDGSDGTQSCSGNNVWSACGNCAGTKKECTPGDTKACACTNGKSGAQTCKSDGTAWQACECASEPGAPLITSITPNSGGSDADVKVTILGKNFQQGIQFMLGSQALQEVNLQADNAATAVVPKGMKAAKYDLKGSNPDGKSYTLPQAYEVTADKGATPIIEKVTPNSGTNDKDVEISIIGKGFIDGAQVRLGSIQANDVRVLGEQSIFAVVPKGLQPEKYDLIVQNPGGERGTLSKGYEVLPAASGGCGCSAGFHKKDQSSLLFLGMILLLLMRRRWR